MLVWFSSYGVILIFSPFYTHSTQIEIPTKTAQGDGVVGWGEEEYLYAMSRSKFSWVRDCSCETSEK